MSFFMPVIRDAKRKILHAKDQFRVVDDEKLRLTLLGLADRYSERIRTMIYRAYNDDQLASIYRGWRNTGMFEKGGKSKIHKEIIRFPNAHVYDFVDTIMTAIYGPKWMQNKKALKHELVRPWYIVNRI